VCSISRDFQFPVILTEFPKRIDAVTVDQLTVPSGFYFLVTKFVHIDKIVLKTENNYVDAELSTKTVHNYFKFHFAIH